MRSVFLFQPPCPKILHQRARRPCPVRWVRGLSFPHGSRTDSLIPHRFEFLIQAVGLDVALFAPQQKRAERPRLDAGVQIRIAALAQQAEFVVRRWLAIRLVIEPSPWLAGLQSIRQSRSSRAFCTASLAFSAKSAGLSAFSDIEFVGKFSAVGSRARAVSEEGIYLSLLIASPWLDRGSAMA